MASQVQEIRDQALADIFSDFEGQLDNSIASFKDSDVSDHDIEVVRNKFKNAFHNYFTTGFDIVFQKELVEKFKETTEAEVQDLNLSVTDEDLQKLDDANSRNAYFRKVFPGKCNLLLERALKIQTESVSKIKSKVHAVEPIEDKSSCSVNVENSKDSKNSDLEINKEITELRTELRDNFDKIRRLENAQSIILSNQNDHNQQ